MDMITDLPISNGYDSILAVVDHGLMKGVILIPCSKTLTAAQCTGLLLDNVYKRFGLMDKIISDRGPQFAAKSFLELLKLLKIKSSLTTAYHPQSDGATERVNQEIQNRHSPLTVTCWHSINSDIKFLETIDNGNERSRLHHAQDI